jgi:hypothetical protein
MDTGRQKGGRKMETRRTRLRRIEKEAQFRRRLDFPRLFENLSDSQIAEIAIYFCFPGPMPEQLPIGMSKVDGLDRETLLSMWEQEEQTISRIMHELKGRNEEEHRFYLHRVHWPELSP